ncbi:right-handed parallel beta-helix repeat-containing protein [Borreliella bavariensis]|uniref:right-handed parallel beta-helix repeat-containing protein n=1 Tax=Borreliella bavariensis TaxID=664662 RepID=UPI001CB7086D|nr:right-handed parallel beta-helix repeat-containing protein [Borreliella bavariensis]
MKDQDNLSQEPADLGQEISDLSQETAEKNSEISSLSQKAEKGDETAEISNPKEDTSENCTSLGLDIIFYTDEGQIFEITPFVDITSIVLEKKIVDPSLKTAASQFSFSVNGLSEEFLNFLFFRNEDIFVKVNDNNTPVFRGILEKFFSRDLFNSTKSVSFTVNDYSSLLKIAFENPVQFPINFVPDWLFVYNPLVKELSLVHLIIEKTKLKDLIDDDVSEAILDKVPAIIIDCGEDVETILQALLYEFGYAYTFSKIGKLQILPIWKSEVINKDVEICSLDAESYIMSKSSSSSYDSTKVIWREGKFQSKEEAISKKRPLYSAPINVAGADGALYVAVLQKGVVYPDFADKVGSSVFQEYDPSWLDTVYKWDFKRREVWHDHYAINEHLAIISTHNLEARFNADSCIKLENKEYFPTKAKLWFRNTSSSQGSRYIYHFDIYGDVFYTTARNVLQTDNADDFYSKKFEYTTRFIFSEESALRLFEFLTNLRVKGHTIVNFRSMQNLNLTDFVKLRLENIGIDHFFLILSKKITNFDLGTKLYEYEGITWGDYTHYEYLTTSTKIGISDYLSGVHKVVIAPFNYDGPETYQFKAPGFKDEDTLNGAIEFAKQAGLNKIKLLKGDFYIYGQVKLNNLEIESDDEVFIRSTGFSKHIFESEKSFKLSGVHICQQPMSELYINGGDLNQEELSPYLEDKSFTQANDLVLCSSYSAQEKTRSSVYVTDANFVYIKNVTFLCARNKALNFKKTKKILLENVNFDSTNQNFDIEDVSNLTLINVNAQGSKTASVANGLNAIIRESSFSNNTDALKLSKFSSLKITDTQFSKNTGTALHLVDITSARLSNNTFTENKVGLENHAFDLLIRDTFFKNALALNLTRKSTAGIRTLDLSTYMQNTKDKQEAA